MIKLFCKHKWEILKEFPLENDGGYCTAYYFIQRCNKCGKLKSKIFRF